MIRLLYRLWAVGIAMALALTFALTGAAAAQSLPPLVVRDDPGGKIGARSAEVRRLHASGRRVELRGNCHSACTLYLALPNACIAPGANFGFHGPAAAGRAFIPGEFDRWSEKIASHYRPALRDWYLTKARHVQHGYMALSGRALIAMGYRPC